MSDTCMAIAPVVDTQGRNMFCRLRPGHEGECVARSGEVFCRRGDDGHFAAGRAGAGGGGGIALGPYGRGGGAGAAVTIPAAYIRAAGVLEGLSMLVGGNARIGLWRERSGLFVVEHATRGNFRRETLPAALDDLLAACGVDVPRLLAHSRGDGPTRTS